MPRSKTYLPDVNVWLALVSRRHIHYSIASSWLETVSDDEVAFCRITQMGLLRLVTNRHAMGLDVLTQIEAWKVYRRLASDARVQFLSEPLGIETAWHELTGSRQPATSVWTDAYLQAFGRLSDAQVVSFDRGFSRFGEPEALILKP
jgi:toxin-antitoxin system PIN domain toxin